MRWSYPFRLAWNQLWVGGLTCRDRWCAGRTVGLSVWCRSHTDAILDGHTP